MLGEWIKRSRTSDVHNSDSNDNENKKSLPSGTATKIIQSGHGELEVSSKGYQTHESDGSSNEATRKRRRLKKFHSDSNDDDDEIETEIPYDNNSVAPSISACSSFALSCPINSTLLDPDNSTTHDLTITKENIVSEHDNESDNSSSMDDGMSAVMECLNLSDQMTEHLVKAFGGESLEMQKEIRLKLRNGRTSIARSATVSTVAELMRPHQSKQQFSLLKEYQLTGIQWLLALHEMKRFGILADEMGLGKTAQTITFLNFLYATKQLDLPSIVACPATLVDNWIMELVKWAPNLRALKYQGSQPERKELIIKFESSFKSGDENEKSIDIIVASLQTITSNWDRSIFFKKHQFGYLVIDEAHYLKNSTSLLYRHIKRNIKSDRRLLLTGSPIQNEIAELQNLLLLLFPNVMSSETLQLATSTYKQHRDVIRQRCLAISSPTPTDTSSPSAEAKHLNSDRFKSQQISDSSISKEERTIAPEVEFLQQVFAPFILRRLKSEVINDLPKKISVVERCILEGRQKEMYLAELVGADSDLGRELSSISIVLHNEELNDDNDTDQNASSQCCSTPPLHLSPDPPSSSKPVSTKQRRPRLKNKQFIQNLMFRLRRICNHPLLYKGHYTPNQIEEVVRYFGKEVEGFCEQPYDRVKSEIDSWCDYEIHQAACDARSSSSISYLKLPSEAFLESTKIRRMLELIDETNSRGAKALIFSQFTTYLDVISETLKLYRSDVPFFRMDGSTIMADRQQMVNQFFIDPNIRLFLLSTKAGGVGLNLTAADTVLLMDQDWNPHNDRQAEDRVHRLGQTQPVTIYRLCCRGSVEESILRCAKRKLYLDEAFGGNADLLSAAILKDCFSSTLAASAKEKTTRKEESPLSHGKSTGRNDETVKLQKRQNKTEDTNEVGNTPKKQRGERVGGGSKNEEKEVKTPSRSRLKNKETKNEKQLQDSPYKANKENLGSKFSPSKKKKDQETKSFNECEITPRRDALLNRFGGLKSNSTTRDSAPKRRREDDSQQHSKRVKRA